MPKQDFIHLRAWHARTQHLGMPVRTAVLCLANRSEICPITTSSISSVLSQFDSASIADARVATSSIPATNSTFYARVTTSPRRRMRSYRSGIPKSRRSRTIPLRLDQNPFLSHLRFLDVPSRHTERLNADRHVLLLYHISILALRKIRELHMAYLNLLAEEHYLFSRVKALRCPSCRAYAFIPHVLHHTYPMIWCDCPGVGWYQYPRFRNYAKYRNY